MTALRRVRRALLGLVGVALLLGLWELYKSNAPDSGVRVLGTRVLPRASDGAMPHLSKIGSTLKQHEVGGSVISLGPSKTVGRSIFDAGLKTLQWAGVGFLVGVLVGLALALLMDSLPIAERAVLPYVVLSQTVPLIALAPLVTSWGQGSSIGPIQWHQWMSVSLIAAYLAFFPVAVGMTRGLKSPAAVHREYFRTTSASWWRTLVSLKLPASVTYLVPALRLAAAAAIVGSIVGEISIGLEGGIGRLIISYSEGATGDPSRVYDAVLGAAALGLVAAALVGIVDLALWRFRKQETV